MPIDSSRADGAAPELTAADYRKLMEFRTNLRRFLHWSEAQARASGLPPAQHQLLLVIKGHSDSRGPTIGEVAEYLLLRHHSAVGLVDRAVEAGLVERRSDTNDRRMVRLAISDAGHRLLALLSRSHLLELDRLADTFRTLWPVLADTGTSAAGRAADEPGSGSVASSDLMAGGSAAGAADGDAPGGNGRRNATNRKAANRGVTERKAANGEATDGAATDGAATSMAAGGGGAATAGHSVRAKRVYEPPAAGDGQRVLVDRLWPRGVTKETVPTERWYRDVAPSAELRRWYGHDIDKFDDFAARYRAELAADESRDVVARLVGLARGGPLTLLTATRNVDHSSAAVLAEEIRRHLCQ